jgi:hypothetical protein
MIYTMTQALHMAGIGPRDHGLVRDLRLEHWLDGRSAAVLEHTTDLESVQRHAVQHGIDIVIIKENINVSQS